MPTVTIVETIKKQEQLDSNCQIFLCLQDLGMRNFLAQMDQVKTTNRPQELIKIEGIAKGARSNGGGAGNDHSHKRKQLGFRHAQALGRAQCCYR